MSIDKARSKPHADLRASQDRASKTGQGWPFPNPRDDLNNLMLAMCAVTLFPLLLELLVSPMNPAWKVFAVAAVIGALLGSEPPPPGLQPV
jgi:hypothetical protein